MEKPTVERIGFIGLGIMGRSMAANLIKAGFSLTVWNRTSSRMEPLVRAGAQAARSPREAAEGQDAVITMVTDSPDVEEVLFGPGGVSEGIRPGAVVIDMSTISPEVTRRLAARLAGQGVDMLDAPVTGGDVGAREGTLSIMVGGKPEVFDRCRPLFEAMGRTIVHVGDHGMGQMCKLCNQVVVALNLLAMAEGLAFAARSGVDLEKMLAVVRAGAAGSWAMDNLAPRVLQGDLKPGFMVRLQQKDLRLALEAANQMHLPLAGTSLVHQLLASVEAYGGGDDGTQAIVRALERLGNFRILPEPSSP
ncbi:MAG: NAD(P)-dependent oxidoreductase [Firmicutes bacterium]|nr:NAD(P)-dependent oxidoreductase [Bacillota bacterium]